MSRMFNMLSGSVATRPEPFETVAARTADAIAPPRDEDASSFADENDDTPFVEIGGPNGPIFSAGAGAVKTAPKPVVVSEPKPAAAEAKPVIATVPEPVANGVPTPIPTAREFPRLAETPRYLSVTFHNLTGARARGPVEGADPGLVALHLPDHPVSAEYRTLRDEIRAQLPEPTPRVLLFTAATTEAGTSTVLLNLAVTLAREEAPRVLVIDANISRPAVARMLALKPTPGLAEVLATKVPLAWAAQPSLVPNLQVLPAGSANSATVTTLGEDLPRLVEQLRQWYDWVLIDGGVWGVVPERDATCPAADAVYLVTREADVTRPEFTGLRGWVKELGGLLRGYITTRV